MLKTTWVYSLKKDELVSHLQQFALATTGTAEELRKRFSKFIAADHDETTLHALLELQTRYEATTPVSPAVRITTPTIQTENLSATLLQRDSKTSVTATPASHKPVSRIQVIELVGKWNLKYDGGKDPVGFIESIEETAYMYEVDLTDVLRALRECLQDKALLWYRNNNKHWTQWHQFKADFFDFFLPARYFEQLEDEVRKRHQRGREPFKDYVLAMQNLMRHTNMTEDQKLERIFRNSHPDYQWYIRRRDFDTLDELIHLAAEFESIPSTTHTGRGEFHRMASAEQTSPDSTHRNPKSNEDKIRSPPPTELTSVGRKAI